MVDHPHPKRLGLPLQIPTNAPHPQHAQHLALGVVPEHRRRLPAPLALAQGQDARIEVAQRADDQEHVDVGGGVVDGRGDVGHADRRAAQAAGVHVDLVVAGA